MFERYLERARRVLFFARYETSQAGGIVIEPSHLLLGILREPGAVTTEVLRQAGVSREQLKDEITRSHGAVSARASTVVEIPFSADTRRVLDYAVEEAGPSPQPIDSDHLLIGVLRLGGRLATLLTNRGVTIEGVRALVAQQQYEPPPEIRGLFKDTHEVTHVPPHLRHPRPDSSPLDADLAFDVRVSPTRQPDGERATRGSNEGVELINLGVYELLHEAYPEAPMSRLEVDGAFDETMRLDMSVRGRDLSRERRSRLIREGLEVGLDATVSVETRSVDVYVITAASDARDRLRRVEDEPMISFGHMSMSYSVPIAEDVLPPRPNMSFAEIRQQMARGFIGGVSTEGTIESFGHMIEDVLGRPVIDETGLKGSFSIQLPEATATSHEDFFARVREQLGLILTPARRDVDFVVLRKN